MLITVMYLQYFEAQNSFKYPTLKEIQHTEIQSILYMLQVLQYSNAVNEALERAFEISYAVCV